MLHVSLRLKTVDLPPVPPAHASDVRDGSPPATQRSGHGAFKSYDDGATHQTGALGPSEPHERTQPRAFVGAVRRPPAVRRTTPPWGLSVRAAWNSYRQTDAALLASCSPGGRIDPQVLNGPAYCAAKQAFWRRGEQTLQQLLSETASIPLVEAARKKTAERCLRTTDVVSKFWRDAERRLWVRKQAAIGGLCLFANVESDRVYPLLAIDLLSAAPSAVPAGALDYAAMVAEILRTL